MDPLNSWIDSAEMRRMAEQLLAAPIEVPTAPDDAGFGGDFIGFGVNENANTHKAVVLLDEVAPKLPEFAPITSQDHTSPHASPFTILTPAAEPQLETKPEPQRVEVRPREISEAPKFSLPVQNQLVPLAPIPVENITPAVTSPPPPLPPPALDVPTKTNPVKIRGPFLERMARFRDGLHGQFSAKGVFILDKDGQVIYDETDHSRLHFMARSLAMAAKKSSDGPGNVHVKVGSLTTLEVIPIETVFGRMVLGILLDQPLTAEQVSRISVALQQSVAPPNVNVSTP